MATAAMVTAAAGSPGSDALRARASTELYNLQQSRAGATYREAIAADPNLTDRQRATLLDVYESFIGAEPQR